MRYQLKNTIRDRLTYCLEWKQNIEVYLANKSISEKANEEYYKSKPYRCQKNTACRVNTVELPS